MPGFNRRRFNPALADPRTRDADAIKRTNDRAAFINARIDSHGADGLNEWLRSNNVLAWGTMDAGEALAIIRKRLGDSAWRAALEVL